MDTFSRKHIASVLGSLLAAAGFLVASAVQAQQKQSRLSDPYTKSAFQSLLAIEQDADSELSDTSMAQKKLDATGAQAATADEASMTEMLRQIYLLKQQDDRLVRAYEKIAEIENAPEPSDGTLERLRRDETVSQMADNEAEIKRREEGCFAGLEQSLRRHSSQNVAACSAWIQHGASQR